MDLHSRRKRRQLKIRGSFMFACAKGQHRHANSADVSQPCGVGTNLAAAGRPTFVLRSTSSKVQEQTFVETFVEWLHVETFGHAVIGRFQQLVENSAAIDDRFSGT